MAETIYNPVASFLSGSTGMGVGDTTFTVSDSSLFPVAFPFRVVMDAEIMLVTAVAAGVFTCTRAQESTIATVHQVGAQVVVVATAGALLAVFAGAIPFTGAVGGIAFGSTAVALSGSETVVPVDGASVLFGGATVSAVGGAGHGIKAGTAGTYLVSARLGCGGSTLGDWARADIGLNGAVAYQSPFTLNAGQSSGSASLLLVLAATDVVNLMSSSNVAVNTYPPFCSLSVVRVA